MSELVKKLINEAGITESSGLGSSVYVVDFYLMNKFAELVAAHEREECAKECDDHSSIEGIAQFCAMAIRTRRKL
mgnify:FL=1